MEYFLNNINNNSQEALSVSELTARIKNTLSNHFTGLWVRGEVSNFYCHNKRHLYFDLNDANAKIRAVMFYSDTVNLDFKIENGLLLNLFGSISVYEKRGEYQLIAEKAQKVSSGELLLALEELRKKLNKLGYFDPACKKPVPLLPQKIGAVTSVGGSVLHDIITVLDKRFGNFHLIVRNVNVQGKTSADEICEALDDLEEFGVDVIIIARGGGSFEDLWAFNTEKVAKKVFDCKIPVISAVGHETDRTICDDVADVRAATPSVAAALSIMNKNDFIIKISEINGRMYKVQKNKINRAFREIDYLIQRRIFRKPKSIILKNIQDFEMTNKYFLEKSETVFKNKTSILNHTIKLLDRKYIISRINNSRIAVGNHYKKLHPLLNLDFANKKNRLNMLLNDLNSLNPVKAVEKGFAVLTDTENKKYIKSISEVNEGQEINIFLKDGSLLSRILEKINKKPDWDGKNDQWN
ncbi:MAG: exodeoxyribonuclease VII large subunit [Actinobacteria bacterium]|nr:exodeoxyribonuclease VII large subunit [Actinomycetota bacterium]